MEITVRRPLKWGILANELALTSSLTPRRSCDDSELHGIMIIGSCLGLTHPFQHWQIALYSLILGICILLIEYPRSYKKGATVFERKYQDYLVPVLTFLGVCGRNYYIRFLLYFCMGTPCCMLLPTLMAGFCIIISSLMYLKAATNGEEWHSKFSTWVENKNPLEPQLLLPWDSLKRTSILGTMKETVC